MTICRICDEIIPDGWQEWSLHLLNHFREKELRAAELQDKVGKLEVENRTLAEEKQDLKAELSRWLMDVKQLNDRVILLEKELAEKDASLKRACVTLAESEVRVRDLEAELKHRTDQLFDENRYKLDAVHRVTLLETELVKKGRAPFAKMAQACREEVDRSNAAEARAVELEGKLKVHEEFTIPEQMRLITEQRNSIQKLEAENASHLRTITFLKEKIKALEGA